ncbi:hypothetical protein SUDANB66_00722 [Streptomyces sp. SudanB66_2053]
MSYDPPRPAGRLLLTPEDRLAPERTRRLRRLGLGERPDPELDAFARGLAELTGAPYAVVNLPASTGSSSRACTPRASPPPSAATAPAPCWAGPCPATTASART